MTILRPSRVSPSPATRALAGFPIALALVMWGVFWSDATRPFGLSLIRSEFGPVELATFAAYMVAAFIGAAAAWLAWGRGRPRSVVIMLLAFACGMFFAGMEEISWGQTYLGFASPRGWSNVNEQDEFNLHNLSGIQDMHSFLLLTIGLASLLAARYFVRRRRNLLRVPGFLMPYLVTITALAAPDYLTDAYPLWARFSVVSGNLAEINEMLIGFTGSLYAICVLRRLRDDTNGTRNPDEPAAASGRSRGPQRAAPVPHRPSGGVPPAS